MFAISFCTKNESQGIPLKIAAVTNAPNINPTKAKIGLPLDIVFDGLASY